MRNPIFWATLLTLVSGCASSSSLHVQPSTLRLHQPAAPPAQRDLTLRGGSAGFLTDRGARDYLLSLPAPGGPATAQDFIIYIHLPDGPGRRVAIGDEPDAARGILVQSAGLLRGKTAIESGWITRSILSGGGREVVELDLRCADGSLLRGRYTFREDPRAVRAFQRRYAKDVGRLFGPKVRLADDAFMEPLPIRYSDGATAETPLRPLHPPPPATVADDASDATDLSEPVE